LLVELFKFDFAKLQVAELIYEFTLCSNDKKEKQFLELQELQMFCHGLFVRLHEEMAQLVFAHKKNSEKGPIFVEETL